MGVGMGCPVRASRGKDMGVYSRPLGHRERCASRALRRDVRRMARLPKVAEITIRHALRNVKQLEPVSSPSSKISGDPPAASYDSMEVMAVDS
jgi:hypothetical protein